jgi:ABC-type nitrate/sulfonate/bicarbonate transport system ATPase subunit
MTQSLQANTYGMAIDDGLIDSFAFTSGWLQKIGQLKQPMDPISLDIEEGKFISLLGPSGCGKSTLLNMIAGFVGKSAGHVLFDGSDVQGPGANRGVVFQEYALFPWMTALENIAFGGLLKRVPKKARLTKAAHYLDLVGLSQHANKFPSEMSGGMKQRIAIARALANDPSEKCTGTGGVNNLFGSYRHR